MFGYTVVDPPSVVSTHLTEVIKRHAHELLGRQETKDFIDHKQQEYTILEDEVTPDPLSDGNIQKLLAKLLKENISIRNLPVIFETLADFSKMTSDTDLLAENVRQSLSSQITKQYTDDHDLIKVITTPPEMENLITSNIQQTEHVNYLAIETQVQKKIIKNIAKEVETASLQSEQIAVLCSSTIQIYEKQLL